MGQSDRHSALLVGASAVLLLISLTGCNGASLVLKSPIRNKCEESGLQGCPQLTDGVLLFIEGDKGGGTKKLVAGAVLNSPGQIKQFAVAIKALEEIPGAGEYTKPLSDIADLLLQTAGSSPSASSNTESNETGQTHNGKRPGAGGAADSHSIAPTSGSSNKPIAAKADWIIVQYGFDGKPINCWRETNVAIGEELNGISWQHGSHYIHISGWNTRVRVYDNAFVEAAKAIGITDLSKCNNGY